jgi:hypothetical protein
MTIITPIVMAYGTVMPPTNNSTTQLADPVNDPYCDLMKDLKPDDIWEGLGSTLGGLEQYERKCGDLPTDEEEDN